MGSGNTPINGKEAQDAAFLTKDGFGNRSVFCGSSFFRTEICRSRNVLSEEVVSQSLAAIGRCWKDRIYSPLVTLWVFLGQVLSADHSCRAAVARLIAHRVSQGQSVLCGDGAYCQARKRLPEEFFPDVACQMGRRWTQRSIPQWLWKGRRVYCL